jgi:cysteine synthase A
VIFPDLAATVGHTPLVELARVARGLPGRVLGKLEMRNPCGSVRDRVGVALVEDAERRGLLRAERYEPLRPIGPSLPFGLAERVHA